MFNIQFTAELPKVGGGGRAGQSKYDWTQFPAPTADPETGKMLYAWAVVEGVKNAKTLRKSIDAYLDRLQAEGLKDGRPVFSIYKVTNDAGEQTGFKVVRKENEPIKAAASTSSGPNPEGVNTEAPAEGAQPDAAAPEGQAPNEASEGEKPAASTGRRK